MEQEQSTHPKTVYFYPDGSSHGEGVRVVIQSNRFRNIEALLEFLTERLPEIPYGVRSIFSPRGRTRVQTITELNNGGHYIASDRRQRAKGIRLEERSILLPGWRAGRPPSGQKLLSYSLKLGAESATVVPCHSQPRSRRQTGKVIYVHQNGDAFHRHRVLLERRVRDNIGFVLQELSLQLCQPVHKLYTLEGHEVQTIDEIFEGPEEYVAVGLEKFRPLSKVQVDLSSKRHRPPERACVHHGPRTLRHRSARAGAQRDVHSGDEKEPHKPAAETPEGDPNCSASKRAEDDGDRRGASTKAGSGLRASRSMVQLPDKQSKRRVPGGNHWLVRITTGRRESRTRVEYVYACTANVFLTVQGTNGTSAPLLLAMYHNRGFRGSSFHDIAEARVAASRSAPVNRSEKPLFSPGCTDEFEVNLGHIGEIVKVRLSHDNSGDHPDLLISHLRMIRLDSIRSQNRTHKEDRPGNGELTSSASFNGLHADLPLTDLTFYFSSWLSRNLGDREVTKEVASRASLGLVLMEQRRQQELHRRSQMIAPVQAALEEPKFVLEEKQPLPNVQYCLRVKTGSQWNSGTKADVTVVLSGEFGASGPRQLWHGESAKTQPFRQDQVDEFRLQCVTLGRLSSLRVWLEQSSAKISDTWYLEWIQVIEEDAPHTTTLSPPSTSVVRQPPTLFYCGQWLESDLSTNDVELTPSVQPIERLLGLNEESDFGFPEKIAKLWNSMAWKFKHGMEISFYSLETGEPFRVLESGEICLAKSKGGASNGKFNFARLALKRKLQMQFN
ncbi:unnamed protein product [Mesocestoides corti]|uniref:Doublecortin domain-containing protein n=2 Tax=Mesocestoides corti TaxID=53468 RepID=A0A0R3UAI9_MESCO|nr:unnamed protein product [Mesocestoides corti]